MKKVSVILAVIILVFCGSGCALFRSDTSSAQNPSVTVAPADSTPAPAESHDAAAASAPIAATQTPQLTGAPSEQPAVSATPVPADKPGAASPASDPEDSDLPEIEIPVDRENQTTEASPTPTPFKEDSEIRVDENGNILLPEI